MLILSVIGVLGFGIVPNAMARNKLPKKLYFKDANLNPYVLTLP